MRIEILYKCIYIVQTQLRDYCSIGYSNIEPFSERKLDSRVLFGTKIQMDKALFFAYDHSCVQWTGLVAVQVTYLPACDTRAAAAAAVFCHLRDDSVAFPRQYRCSPSDWTSNSILSNNCREHQHGLFVCCSDDTARASFLAAACL